jgi:branched-subunit amino acid aminotransferase/4-amino-4-deoxychorismate lyase
MGDRLAYLDGELRRSGEIVTAIEDQRLAHDVGIYETLLVQNGQAGDVAAHLDRLDAALVGLGLDAGCSREQLADAITAVAASAPVGVFRMRLAVCAMDRANVVVTTTPYAPPAPAAYLEGVPVTLGREVTTAVRERQWKTLAGRRDLAGVGPAAASCFDRLYVNDFGRPAEGLRSNIIVSCDGRPTTPPLSEGCLPGTVRRRLLEIGAVAEGEIEMSTALSGVEVALTNSLAGVIAVSEIDDHRCRVGTMANELRLAWEGLLR